MKPTFFWLALGVLMTFMPGVAKGDFPTLATSLVLPGCKIARVMDDSSESLSAASAMFAADASLAMSAGYCAAWAAEAFDRYADKRGCFTNDMSVDDLILVVIGHTTQHLDYDSMPFLAVAEGAIRDRWPECIKKEKQ
jgi:hypothetical protein